MVVCGRAATLDSGTPLPEAAAVGQSDLMSDCYPAQDRSLLGEETDSQIQVLEAAEESPFTIQAPQDLISPRRCSSPAEPLTARLTGKTAQYIYNSSSR